MHNITIENPYKLDGLVDGGTTYMIRYEGRNLSHPKDNYSWTVLNVLGNYGRITIEREISNAFQIPSVKCHWKGNEIGEEWLKVDMIQNSKSMIDYMVGCIDGKFDN